MPAALDVEELPSIYVPVILPPKGVEPSSPSEPASLHTPHGHRWPEWIALTTYAAIVAGTIPTHEPWADEAQSWQIARSLPLTTLFRSYIRYEGSPGLWHALLWAFNRLHISYSAMHWICGAIAVAATFLLVFKAPFPRYLRLALPFTYFLIFQYAVVARSYVLAPLLLFLVAMFWKKSPLAIALLLGLLGNVSLHVAVISAGLAVVYAIEQARGFRLLGSAHKRKLLFAAGILACFYSFSLYTAWPPADLMISRVRGQSRSVVAYSVASLVWGICQPWILSFPFWLIVAYRFAQRKRLLYLLPVAFFTLFSGAVYANWWHVGLLFPLLICLLWITWPEAAEPVRTSERVCRYALVFVIATQMLWGAYAVYFDHRHPFSPDRAAADYLRPHVEHGDSIAVTYVDHPTSENPGITQAFDCVGIMPYFNKNIFANVKNTFWWWSANDRTEEQFQAVLPSRPSVVLVEVVLPSPSTPIHYENAKFLQLHNAGYSMSQLYCGSLPEQLKPGLTVCHLIYEHQSLQASVH